MTGLLNQPYRQFLAHTPSDSIGCVFQTRAVYVGVTGNLAVVDTYGVTTIFTAVVGWHPIAVAKILATGTTATAIVIAR